MFISGGGDSDLYAVMARTGGQGLNLSQIISLFIFGHINQRTSHAILE